MGILGKAKMFCTKNFLFEPRREEKLNLILMKLFACKKTLFTTLHSSLFVLVTFTIPLRLQIKAVMSASYIVHLG